MDLTYTNPAVYEVHIDDMVDFLVLEDLEQQGVLNHQSQELLDYVRTEIGRERIDAAVADWCTVKS